MSEHEFHVHGAHEHEIEHQAQHGVSLAQYVAIFTALLSAFAAVMSFHSSLQQSEAMLLKNEAVIKQSQAADQWSFYQATSNKMHLIELASDLVPAKADYYKQKAAKYTTLKNQINQKAQALDAEFLTDNQESDRLMRSHHKESEAMMFLQIAIAMASITALTRKRWLFGLAGLAAFIGIVISVISWVAV